MWMCCSISAESPLPPPSFLPPFVHDMMWQSTQQGDSTLFVQKAGPTRESLEALLEGATPLHCAALRGDLRQTQQLLKIGANAYVRTSAGELPLEFVPICWETHCSCPWPHPSINLGQPGSSESARSMRHIGYGLSAAGRECLSRETRILLAKKTIAHATGGLLAWFKMMVLAMLCVLGLWGQHPTLLRPSIEQHATRREEERRQKVRPLPEQCSGERGDAKRHIYSQVFGLNI